MHVSSGVKQPLAHRAQGDCQTASCREKVMGPQSSGKKVLFSLTYIGCTDLLVASGTHAHILQLLSIDRGSFS